MAELGRSGVSGAAGSGDADPGRRSRSGPWAAFRAFRRSRPFWAGGFTIVAGGEILLFPLTPISSLIQLGIGAISGVVFGIALIVLGLFMWFSPPNRTLAGVLTILVALASFVTSNLGGLVVGMILGLIGGGLCLAWTPRRPPPRSGKGTKKKRRPLWRKAPRKRPAPAPAEDDAAETQDLFADAERGRPTARPRPGRRRPLRPEEYPDGRGGGSTAGLTVRVTGRLARGRRVAGTGSVLAALALTVAVATPGTAVAQDCVLGIVCENEPAPPAGTTAPPPPSSGGSEGARTGSTAPRSAGPSATVAPTTTPGGPLAGLSDSLGEALGQLPNPLPPLTPAQIPILEQLLPQLITPLLPTVESDGRVVSSGLISNTQMDTLTVTNFRFVGVVTHPVAGGGTIRALRVIVDSTDIGNLSATLPGPISTAIVNQRAGSPNASSNVLILDLTRISLKLFGVIPIEFSFAFPPPPLIVIPVLSATDVDIDFVQLMSDPTIPGLVLGIGPASTGPPSTDTAAQAAPQTALASLLGMAALTDQPALLTPYGLTEAQARQAVAEYERDPGAVAAAQQGGTEPTTESPAPETSTTPDPAPSGTQPATTGGAEGGPAPASPRPSGGLLGPGA